MVWYVGIATAVNGGTRHSKLPQLSRNQVCSRPVDNQVGCVIGGRSAGQFSNTVLINDYCRLTPNVKFFNGTEIDVFHNADDVP
jgi:hypothetical protein